VYASDLTAQYFPSVHELTIALIPPLLDRRKVMPSDRTQSNGFVRWIGEITHLNACGVSSPFDGRLYVDLHISQFPRLTHLSFPWSDARHESITEIVPMLRECKALQMVVIAYAPPFDPFEFEDEEVALMEWAQNARSVDARFYVVDASSVDPAREWAAIARGAESIWEKAERLRMQWGFEA